ncbi:MAG: sugar ABC transporter substrate-binding protein [Hungatella sp.]|nr:sugar ABC transporter substrate-binding protein [uncultured Acetatifactor sp.]MCI9362180.1 sugar ABC transporter substrate-binding protein [Hungatella sp.]
MKKWVVTLAALTAAGMMTGCQNNSGQSGQPQGSQTAAEQTKAAETKEETKAEASSGEGGLSGELYVVVNSTMTKNDDPAILRAAKAFEEQYPDTKITIEGLSGNDILSKFTTSAMAGAGPDVVALDNAGWPIDLAAMGLLEPLDEQLKSTENKYLQGPLDSGLFEGSYYSVPWYYNNTGLYYNKRILEEIGKTEPPANWAEFEEDIKLATEKGYAGVSTRPDGYAIFNFFFQNENPVIDTSGDRPVVTVNNESGKEAFEFWTGLHTKYHAFPEGMKDASDWAAAYNTFTSDDCLFFICGDWAYKNLESSNPNLDFGLAVMPKGKVQAVCLGGKNLAININSKNKELAWAFVEYLTSKECDFVLTEKVCIAGRSDVDVSGVLAINPDYQVFVDEAEYTVPRPRVKNSASLDEKVADAFKKVLFDQMSAQEALDELEQELIAFIDENY